MSKWERGVQRPNADLLDRLAELYHVDTRELLRGEALSADVPRETPMSVSGEAAGGGLPRPLRQMVHDFEAEAFRLGAIVEDMDYLRASLSDDNLRRLLGDASMDRPLSADEQRAELEIRLEELRHWLKRRVQLRKKGRR